ncbi:MULTISPECIES: hypothetical protein [unclassified Bradyrhizobium]
MMIEYSPEKGLRLAEPFDSRRFKLVLKGPLAATFSDLKGITLVDHDNALVPIDLVPVLPGCPKHNEIWEAAYAKMVAAARERGWIDASANAIRAHIERF